MLMVTKVRLTSKVNKGYSQIASFVGTHVGVRASWDL